MRVGELKKAVVAVVVCIWTDGTSVTICSGYARVEHGNDSSRSSSVEGVNTRSFATWYFEVWQITLYHVVDLLTIHGPVRDPYPRSCPRVTI